MSKDLEWNEGNKMQCIQMRTRRCMFQKRKRFYKVFNLKVAIRNEEKEAKDDE